MVYFETSCVLYLFQNLQKGRSFTSDSTIRKKNQVQMTLRCNQLLIYESLAMVLNIYFSLKKYRINSVTDEHRSAVPLHSMRVRAKLNQERVQDKQSRNIAVV